MKVSVIYLHTDQRNYIITTSRLLKTSFVSLLLATSQCDRIVKLQQKFPIHEDSKECPPSPLL